MRVIAGEAKGRKLRTPSGGKTRPLTGRVRESLFSSLGVLTVDADVLDLYAGTGSIGLEALSRGARRCVFVERNRSALEALRANVAAVALGGEIVADDVERYLAGPAGPFDLVFVDPPYALPLASLAGVLERLLRHLADGAVVVVHRRSGGDPPPVAPGMRLVDRRRFGDSELFRYEFVSEEQEDT